MSTIEEELKNNGSYAAVAFGESMRPTLTPKTDVVIIEPCKAMPKKYDVILYRNDSGKYILHRVVRVKKECLVTRGDNTYVNEYVPFASVVGIMTSFVRNGNRIEGGSKSFISHSKKRLFFYPIRKIYVKTRAFFGKIKRSIIKKESK